MTGADASPVAVVPDDSPGDPAPPPEDETQKMQDAAASESSAVLTEAKPLPSTPAGLAPLWSRVIRAENISPLLRAVLINSTLESLETGRATLVCSARYAADAQKKWRGSITELLSREAGTPIDLTILSTDGAVVTLPAAPAADSASAPPPNPSSSTPSPAPSRPGAPNNAADHPLVKQALELFGGRIVDIQPRKR